MRVTDGDCDALAARFCFQLDDLDIDTVRRHLVIEEDITLGARDSERMRDADNLGVRRGA